MTDISSILTRAPFTPKERRYRWRALLAASGGGKVTPAIRLSGASLLENSAVDTFIGTLSVSGAIGTPSFTLVDSSTNKAKLTGSNILAGSSATNYETTPSFNIIVSVSGVTPAIANATFSINVTNVVEDTTPDAFSFTDVTGAALLSVIASNAVTITGVDGPCDVVLTGTALLKEYRINGGAWGTTGQISNGQTLEVRGASVGSALTAVTVIATVGGNVTTATADTFSITTADIDTTPSAFVFTDITNATLSTLYESNAITVLAINSPATMTVTGGEYQVNGGAWASTSTTVVLNDSVKVRGTSSSSNSTAVNVVLTIGGVSDTYTITTVAGAALTAPTMNLQAASDTGSSSTDNITSLTSLGFDVTAIDATVTDSVTWRLYKNGVLADTTVATGATVTFSGVSATAGTDNWTVTYQVGANTSAVSANETVTVDLTAPTISTSSTASVAENTTLSVTLAASETVTWSLTGGADVARFEISGTTLRWLSNGTKDFEAPNDADTNNIYVVQVTATDVAGNATNKTISVTVTDAAEDTTAPTITTSSTANVNENATLSVSLTANETVTWSLTGGADVARFEISGTTLRWLSNGTKDFEAPNDADTNNVYVVQVTATDLSSNATNKTISVTVVDVAEGVIPPNTIFGSDLIAWYKADTGVSDVGSGVCSNIPDQSGHGYTLTTGALTYSATGYDNSQPQIGFPGTASNTALIAGGTPFTTSTATGAVFVCGKMQSGTESYGRIASFKRAAASSDTDNAGSFAFVRNAATNAIQGYRNFSTFGPADQTISLNTHQRWGIVFDGTNQTLYVNGAAGTPVANTSTWTGAGDFIFGAGAPFTTRFVGSMVEMVVVLAATPTQIAQLDAYFESRPYA